MLNAPSRETLTAALEALRAEALPGRIISELARALDRAVPIGEGGSGSSQVDTRWAAVRSTHGSLSLYDPRHDWQRRLATFDRGGRLLFLALWADDGRLQRLKARNLDGQFVGVFPESACHLGWGTSDGIHQLVGERGFEVARALSVCQTVPYGDIKTIPPLDDPTRLPPGVGSTLLNVLAVIARDQRKATLRYRGPYPSERLFATLRESFRHAGEPSVARERFTRGAQQAAVQLRAIEPEVDWRPDPHERYFPAEQTCVQLRDGVEKLYDCGRTYFRPDLAGTAYGLRRVTDGRQHYVASLLILGHPVEDHLVLDRDGEILERPAVERDRLVGGDPRLGDEWKAALVRLIATESTPLLRSALWPAMARFSLKWGEVTGDLLEGSGHELILHAGMVRVYRALRSTVRSAGAGLLLASRFLTELSRIIGPLVRRDAQQQLAELSPPDRQAALLLLAPEPAGLSDQELRVFLTNLAQGDGLPSVE